MAKRKNNYPKERKTKTGAAIVVTGHTSREEYHREYSRLYRERNRQYYRDYYHKNKEQIATNGTRFLLKQSHGAFWLDFKKQIKEIEMQLQELKKKNKEFLAAINEKIKSLK